MSCAVWTSGRSTTFSYLIIVNADEVKSHNIYAYYKHQFQRLVYSRDIHKKYYT